MCITQCIFLKSAGKLLAAPVLKWCPLEFSSKFEKYTLCNTHILLHKTNFKGIYAVLSQFKNVVNHAFLVLIFWGQNCCRCFIFRFLQLLEQAWLPSTSSLLLWFRLHVFLLLQPEWRFGQPRWPWISAATTSPQVSRCQTKVVRREATG